MKTTSLVDREYFVANYEKIVNSKDKALLNAINNLIMFEEENFLLFNKNTEKITSVSQNNVYFFNQALVKDIVKSYDEFNKSILTIHESEYSELLKDNLVVFDRELSVETIDNELKVIDKEELEKTKEFFGDYMKDNSIEKIEVRDIHMKSSYLRNTKESTPPLSFDNSAIFSDNRYKKLMGFYSSSEVIFDVYLKEKDEARKFLLVNGIKVNKKSASYIPQKDNKIAKIDISTKRHFLEEVTKNITGLYPDTFVKLSKKTEMFIYGNLVNDSHYISKNTGRYTYKSINPEYGQDTKRGRDALDDLRNDYTKYIYTLKNLIKSGTTPLDALEKLKEIPFETEFLKKILEESTNVIKDTNTDKENFGLMNTFVNLSLEIQDKEFASQEKYISTNISKFYKAKESVDKSIEIFNNIQGKENSYYEENIDINDFNKLAKNFRMRTRAGILDNKVDSYILNLREEPYEMSDNLKEEYNSDIIVKEIVDNLISNNKYYDYFEIDKDFFDGDKENGDKEKNRREMLSFSKTLENLKMPVIKKGAFKIRKLGVLKATGVYYSGANTIAVDWRRGNYFQSLKHEEVHRIDLSSQLNKAGRTTLVNSLHSYFVDKLKGSSKIDYFLKEEELIARAGEVAGLLLEGNFSKHHLSYLQNNITETQLWEKVKEDFEKSETAIFMHNYSRYKESPEYLNFEECTSTESKEYEIINFVNEYFKPFFTKEATNSNNLKISESTGWENREIEGINAKNFLRINYNKEELEDVKLTTSNQGIAQYFLEDIDVQSLSEEKTFNLEDEINKGNFSAEVMQEIERQEKLQLFDFAKFDSKDNLEKFLSNHNAMKVFKKYINFKNLEKLLDEEDLQKMSKEERKERITLLMTYFDYGKIDRQVREITFPNKIDFYSEMLKKSNGSQAEEFLEEEITIINEDEQEDFRKCLIEIVQKVKPEEKYWGAPLLMSILLLHDEDIKNIPLQQEIERENFLFFLKDGIHKINAYYFESLIACTFGKRENISYKIVFSKIMNFVKENNINCTSQDVLYTMISKARRSNKDREPLNLSTEEIFELIDYSIKKDNIDIPNSVIVINTSSFVNQLLYIVNETNNTKVEIFDYVYKRLQQNEEQQLELCDFLSGYYLQNINSYKEFQTLVNYFSENLSEDELNEIPEVIKFCKGKEIVEDKKYYTAIDYLGNSEGEFNRNAIYLKNNMVACSYALKQKKYTEFLDAFITNNSLVEKEDLVPLVIALNEKWDINIIKEMRKDSLLKKDIMSGSKKGELFNFLSDEVGKIYDEVESVNTKDIVKHMLQNDRETTIQKIRGNIHISNSGRQAIIISAFSKNIKNFNFLKPEIETKKINLLKNELSSYLYNKEMKIVSLAGSSHLENLSIMKQKQKDEYVKVKNSILESYQFASSLGINKEYVKQEIDGWKRVFSTIDKMEFTIGNLYNSRKAEDGKMSYNHIKEISLSLITYIKENNLAQNKGIETVSRIIDKINYHDIKINGHCTPEERKREREMCAQGVSLLSKMIDNSPVIQNIPLVFNQTSFIKDIAKYSETIENVKNDENDETIEDDKIIEVQGI